MAGDVEDLGVGEVGDVAVGRPVHEHDLLAGADGHAVQLDVARRRAAHVVDRRHVTDELLGGDGEVGAAY